jgi:putative nucleotidyltransferase with HDIG domain
MATTAAATVLRQRESWDTPDRPPALERFYRELMAVDKLPSAPEVAQKMLVAVNRENINTRELTGLISRDQALTARLLRLANSAFFAVRTKVTSIQQAVTLLGFGRVRDLALGLSVWGALDAKSAAGRQWRTRLWTHSAAVAAAAKMLAERVGGDGPAAFTAGLLHDIGKLVLGIRLGDSYWSMLDEAAERGESSAAVERESFQCHHGTVAGWLLQMWQLPPALVEAVAYHHEPLVPDYGLDLPLLVAIADRLVLVFDASNGEVSEDALDEIRAAAPGLLEEGTWQEFYLSLSREQGAVAGMFTG